MNKARRAELESLRDNLVKFRDDLSASKDAIEGLKDQIADLKDEEVAALDNMPEAFQQAERGQAAEAAISELDDAINSLEEAAEHIGAAMA